MKFSKFLLLLILFFSLILSACDQFANTLIPLTTPNNLSSPNSPSIEISTPSPTLKPTPSQRPISYANNYFFPTQEGIRIISDIPENVDELRYYDSSTKLFIGSSTISGEIIDYKSELEYLSIQIMPVIGGIEQSDFSFVVMVNRVTDKGIANIRYDPISNDLVSVSLYIPNQNAFNELFLDNHTMIQNNVENIIAYSQNGQEVDIKFLPTPINSNWEDIFLINISYPSFPLYIGYSVKSLYENKGTYHNDYLFIYRTTDYLNSQTDTLLMFKDFGTDTELDLFFDIPKTWKAIVVNGQGELVEHSPDYKKYSISSLGGFIALGEIGIQEFSSNGFTQRYGWFTSFGSLESMNLGNSIEETAWLIDQYTEKIGPLPIENLFIQIVPYFENSRNLGEHHQLGIGNTTIPYHAIVRTWIGESPNLQSDSSAGMYIDWWLTNGLTDALFTVKNHNPEFAQTQLNNLFDNRGANDLMTSIPNTISVYKNEVIGSKADIPLNSYRNLPEGIGPGNEFNDYSLFRLYKNRLAFIIFDMLLHCSSDGNVHESFEIVSDLYNRPNVETQPISLNEVESAIRKYSNYNFSAFINNYANSTGILNADVYLSEDDSITAFTDYSTDLIQISNPSLGLYQISGSILQDSYMGISSEKQIGEILVNGIPPNKLYSPWGNPQVIAFAIPSGEFEVKVTYKP